MRHEQGNVLVSTLGFSLGLILVFTLVANILPQVEGEAPVEKEVDIGSLTMDGLVSMGEELFSGKGTCTLCHNSMGRAPDILVMNMVEVSQERLKDERYQGEAANVEQYLRESMVDPGRYVVATYGKKGSNDTESPMPIVNKTPINLTDIEMDALIAFMQAKDGGEITVALPTEVPEAAKESSASANGGAPAVSGEEAIAKFGCSACHQISGTGGDLGPALGSIRERMDRVLIQQAIIDPDAVVAEGYAAGLMPTNFAETMTVRELQMVIDTLQQQ